VHASRGDAAENQSCDELGDREEADDKPTLILGHEFIGIVEDVGADVRTVKRGDLVVAPFA